MTRALDIWWDGQLVGQLTQDDHGELGFAYSAEWLERESALALSASLPKRTERYSRRECRPFFGGLLPDEGQRDVAARVLGVSPRNDFALLDRLGGDVAGALQLLPPGKTPSAPVSYPRPEPLDEEALSASLMLCQFAPCLRAKGACAFLLPAHNQKCQWFW